MAEAVMSAEVRRMRDRVVLEPERVSNCTSSAYPNAYFGIDDTWNLASFQKNFKINIIKMDDTSMEFDMIGVDAAIANTFRRILIAEVPTMAVETCFFHNNTTLLQDEILAHRFGLVPLRADPRKFAFWSKGQDKTAQNYFKLRLQVKCEKNPLAPADSSDPKDKYLRSNVYSSDMKWVPLEDDEPGLTADMFEPVIPNILLCKMRPGQEIDVEMHCIKGEGKEHAKWSPVATASYRLLPDIRLLAEIKGEKAHRLAAAFSPGVIAVQKNEKGEDIAIVVDSRRDTMSREVYRHDDLKDLVAIERIRDHFIFSIESTGCLTPKDLFDMACEVLVEKCDYMLQKLQALDTPDE